MPLMGPILSFGYFSAALLTLVAAVVIGAFWVGWGLLLAPAQGNKDAARATMERGHNKGGETASVPSGKEEDAGTGSMAPPPVGTGEDGKEDSGAVAVTVGYCASTAMDGERKAYEFAGEVVGALASVDGNRRELPDVAHHLAEREDEDVCAAQIPPVPAASEKNDHLSDSETVPPPAASVEDKDHPLAADHCAPPSPVERETGLHDDNILEEFGAALPLVGEEDRAPADIVALSVPERHQEDKQEGSAFVEIASVHNANQNKDALTGTATPPMPREEDGKELSEVEEANKDHHVGEQVDVAVVARDKTDVPLQEAPRTTAVNVSKADKHQIGELTLEKLKAYDGSDAERPLLLAIKGNIYDVSTSRQLYGPGGHYELFGGRDVTRALALMSFEPEDLTGKIDDLKKADLEVLGDWEQKFTEKYPRVGCLIAIESDDAKQHP